MRQLFNKLLVAVLFSSILISCKKNLEVTTMKSSPVKPSITLSPATIVLSQATESDTVQVISWSKSEYGFSAAVSYTLQMAKAGTNFATSVQQINVGNKTSMKFIGGYLNSLAIASGLAIGSGGQLDVRIKSSLSDSLSIFSDKVTLNVTTYQTAYPALLVKGGNSWHTPVTRTDAYVLTSPDYSSKYEGYLNLPNADGYGGDAFTLLSSTTGSSYGWGTSNTTMSVGGGNLWLTPAPNYMKVNVDVNALTINFVPVKFYLSGDQNGWSTSATPMTFNTATNKWVVTNVSFTAGNKFVFTSNGNYDISYKVDATGKLMFAGPPAWAGNNISAPAVTGVYTVTLDLSKGNGMYSYTIQ
jgi:starch-binding outer membrane protein SusE/F